MKLKLASALLAPMLLVLTACGGGGMDDQTVEDFSAALQDEKEGMALSEKRADCWAGNVGDEFTDEEFKDTGFFKDGKLAFGESKMNKEDAGVVTDAALDCFSIADLNVESIDQFAPKELGNTDDLKAEVAKCYEDFDKDIERKGMIADLTQEAPGEEVQAAAQEAQGCTQKAVTAKMQSVQPQDGKPQGEQSPQEEKPKQQ